MGKVVQFPQKKTLYEATDQIVVLNFASKNFGILTERVVEIISGKTPLEMVPNAPNWLSGFITIRGHLIPVVQLGKLKNIDSSPNIGEKIVILEIGQKYIGFEVGEVLPDLTRVANNVSLPGLEKWPEFVEKLVPDENSIIGIISPEKILSDTEIDEIWKYSPQQ
ncbi:MAG: chemotaxis protein CheW [Candidatus Riflebacteria bacterium]|nr:chemotaxis protein CheW [Candidatus Riflebacteria bacterium]